MKAFIALFVCLVVVSAYDKKTAEDLTRFRKECADTLKTPKELQEKYVKYEYPDDEISQKHVLCVAKKFESWKDNEGYLPDTLLAQFGEEKKPIIEKCVSKRNPDWTEEKWAWNDWTCLVANGINK